MFVWTREKKNANFHDEIHKDNSNSINENDNLIKVLTGKKSIDFFPLAYSLFKLDGFI